MVISKIETIIARGRRNRIADKEICQMTKGKC